MENLEVIKTDYGRGIRSKSEFNKGDIICKVPCIPIDTKDITEDSILWSYVFNSKELNKYYIALGYGSLFNHNEDANVNWKILDNEIEFYAIKDIKINDELTINYGYNPIDHNKELRVDTDEQNSLINELKLFSNIPEIKTPINKLINYFSNERDKNKK